VHAFDGQHWKHSYAAAKTAKQRGLLLASASQAGAGSADGADARDSPSQRLEKPRLLGLPPPQQMGPVLPGRTRKQEGGALSLEASEPPRGAHVRGASRPLAPTRAVLSSETDGSSSAAVTLGLPLSGAPAGGSSSGGGGSGSGVASGGRRDGAGPPALWLPGRAPRAGAPSQAWAEADESSTQCGSVSSLQSNNTFALKRLVCVGGVGWGGVGWVGCALARLCVSWPALR
jgi:hypothetical protein